LSKNIRKGDKKMKDLLIPIGLLAFIIVFVYAMIHTARKQRKSKQEIFKDFANKNGLRYLAEDDGTAQAFAQDFDGIGKFHSPSLGTIIPKDVVNGVLNDMPVILFRHRTRFMEGYTMEWFVAGLTAAESIANGCSIQFCKKKSSKDTMYLQHDVVKELPIGSFYMVVRADSPSDAGHFMDDPALNQLAELAENLSFRPEIQIRGQRVTAYLADRNATIETVEALEELIRFNQNVSSL